MAVPAADFYAKTISGEQRLPNGNTPIRQGPDGLYFEVAMGGEKVWEYDSGGRSYELKESVRISRSMKSDQKRWKTLKLVNGCRE